MPFYKELLLFLAKDRAIDTLYTYGTPGGGGAEKSPAGTSSYSGVQRDPRMTGQLGALE